MLGPTNINLLCLIILASLIIAAAVDETEPIYANLWLSDSLRSLYYSPTY